MSEANKPDTKTAGGPLRRPEPPRKPLETGTIRQSFSHGRSKTVAVEVKKKRVVAPPAAPKPAAAAPRPAIAPVPAAPAVAKSAPPPAAAKVEAKTVAAPAPPPVAKIEAAPPPPPVAQVVEAPPSPPPPPPPAAKVEPPRVEAKPALAKAPAVPAAPAAKLVGRVQVSAGSRAPTPAARADAGRPGAPPPPKTRMILKSLTSDEKAARARALVSAQQKDKDDRKRAEEDAIRRAEEEKRLAVEREAAAKRAEEEATRKAKDEETRKRAETEAARRLQDSPEAPAAAGEDDDEARGRKKGPGGRVEVRKPQRGIKEEPRRRGRLTLSSALNEDERQKSLAAFRRQHEREKRRARGSAAAEAPKKVLREVVVPETITVQELANRMAERSADVIKALMRMGVMATINQSIDADTAELIVGEFGHSLKRVSDADIELGLGGTPDADATLEARAPVVTVMGHVDHGKTSLLDALRETDVAGGEAGGITQHIGAYQVTLKSGKKITFLDTPGHEAFTAMRARGAKVTDIVVLVVAADDGVMPQTAEAIAHAKAAKVPLIVAVNKVDKPDANPRKVREELLRHEIQVEDLGGEVQAIDVSAKQKTGLDRLEEAILLQAEILELKANPDRPGLGVVIEAKLDRGRGPVATALVQRGQLKVGDIVVAGSSWGRVRALLDDRGRAIDDAGPAMPVELLGLDSLPEAGDEFAVVESEARAREVTAFRSRRLRDQRVTVAPRGTLEQMFGQIKAGQATELAVVVKADVQGSLEAIVGALSKIGNDQAKVRVLHGAVGGINESDVTLAAASNALIVGFNVRANKQARDLAQRDKAEIRYYSIIYDLTEDITKALTGMLEPTRKEVAIGNAEVLQIFDISKVGKIAGCRVTDGLIRRSARLRLLRDNIVVHEGGIKTLRHFKEDVREIKAGNECGIAFDNYQDLKPGDVIEAYEVQQVARTL